MKHFLVMVLLGLSLAGQAFGTTLLGQTVQFSHAIDSLPAGPGGADSFRCAPTDYVVGAGVEVANCDGFVSVDLSDTSILMDFLITATPTAAGLAFNGLHFFDVLGGIAPIVAVTVDGSTNIAGVASRVTFDANNIRLDMAGMAALSTSIIQLNVEVAPEPSTILLIGTGFAGLIVLRRRIARL